MGGCDMFLPASSCELPADWKAEMLREKGEWMRRHGELREPSLRATVAEMIDMWRERRVVAFTEFMGEMEPNELHHSARPGWQREQMALLAEPLAYLRTMPECWWQRQVLSYHFRTTRDAGHRLLALVARSLNLLHPNASADHAQRYADARSPAPTHTAQWWLSIQAIKLEWQLHQLDPSLIATLRREVTGQASPAQPIDEAPSTEPRYRLPLLGYSFIRHGDKALETNTLYADADYLHAMHRVAQERGVWSWYLGADDLLSSVRVRQANAGLSPPLHLHTSALVDAIPMAERAASPLSTGFHWGAMPGLTDGDREAVIWRTVLDWALAQVADVFVSTWTSNHPRVAYEMATALGDDRANAPFVGLDAQVEIAHDKTILDLGKQGKVRKC